MSTNPEQGWGTWSDAERWRQDAFKERTPAARLAWLEDIWLLRQSARNVAEQGPEDPDCRSVSES
jgi:hypothetical protein